MVSVFSHACVGVLQVTQAPIAKRIMQGRRATPVPIRNWLHDARSLPNNRASCVAAVIILSVSVITLLTSFHNTIAARC